MIALIYNFFFTRNFVGIVEPIPVKQAAKDYLERAVNITLLAGLTELCKKKPEDPVVSSAHNLDSFIMFNLSLELTQLLRQTVD